METELLEKMKTLLTNLLTRWSNVEDFFSDKIVLRTMFIAFIGAILKFAIKKPDATKPVTKKKRSNTTYKLTMEWTKSNSNDKK